MLTDISSESVAAVLPLYVTGALGLSMVAYGFLEGLHQGISAVVRIAAGYTADRSNHPKPVALAGYGLSVVARIGLLFVQGFTGITAIVGVDRIGKGIRTAPRDAMIQESSQPEHLARSFGLHRMLDTIGATIGPLLAFVVLLFVPGGYRVVFVVSLAAAVLGVAVLGLIVPNRRLHRSTAFDSRPDGTGTANFRPVVVHERPRLRMLVRGKLRYVLVAAGVLGLVTVGDGFVYLALMEHGQLQTQLFPLLFVGSNAVFLALAVPLGRMADRTSRAGVFVLGHLALAASYLVAGLGGSVPMILLCLFLLGVFYAATDGVLAALAGQLSPAGATSTGIAAAQTVVAVTRLVASTGFGILWIILGAIPTMVGAAVVLAVLVPLAWYLLSDRTQAAQKGGSA
jgi:Na+/melibiose symporter and related transporters